MNPQLSRDSHGGTILNRNRKKRRDDIEAATNTSKTGFAAANSDDFYGEETGRPASFRFPSNIVFDGNYEGELRGAARHFLYKLPPSPLRYPGGKARVLKHLLPLTPSTVDEYREPFAGGASMAFAVARLHPEANIWINDLYRPVYCFWAVLRDNCERLVEDAHHLRNEGSDEAKGKAVFARCKSDLKSGNLNDEDTAVAFYTVNRASYSGLSVSGSYAPSAAPTRWTHDLIDALPHFSAKMRHWRITNLDYSAVMNEPWTAEEGFAYLDPPYDIESSTLYGSNGSTHRSFDHDRFARVVVDESVPTVISYNDCPQVRARFPGWDQKSLNWNYSMQSGSAYREKQVKRQELVLRNYPAGPSCAKAPLMAVAASVKGMGSAHV